MNVLLIDLHNIFHVEWHAGTNKDARYPFRETMGRIRAIAKQYDFCGIMTDGAHSFRADLDSRWKANRAEKEAGLFAQLGEVERQLDAEGFHVFKVDGFEADDLAASAVHQLMRGYAIEPGQAEISITINSGDRDMLSLLEPGVRMLKATAPHSVVQADDVRNLKNIGVDPPKIRDFLLLCDKHNGVKYFDGIGPVHAARLLNLFGDMAGIISALDNRVIDTDQYEVHPPSIRAAIKKALSETIDGRPLLDVAMQVVTLRTDAPIDIKRIFEKREPKTHMETQWEESDGPNASADEGRPDIGRVVEKEPAVGNQPMGVRGGKTESSGDMPSSKGKVVDGPDASSDAGRQDPNLSGVQRRGSAASPVVVESLGGNQGPSEGARRATAMETSATLIAPRWELALEPTGPSAAWRLAQTADRAGFWTKHGGPDGCLMIILAGRSRGLTAFDALNGMHIIEGKPVFGAYLLIGMVQRDPRCAYFELVESDEKHAKWITKRKGSKIEQSRTYTIEQATKAELNRPTYNGKASNWMKHPEDMLIKTAGAKLTRAAWADITSGAVAAEEMGYE